VLERGGSGGGGGGGGGGAAAPPPNPLSAESSSSSSSSTAAAAASAGAAVPRKARTTSLDFLAEPFDEASALRLSPEELVAALKRQRESCRRLLERAQAAEAEVAALRSGYTPNAGGASIAALRGEA
jgi:hypothetical protein